MTTKRVNIDLNLVIAHWIVAYEYDDIELHEDELNTIIETVVAIMQRDSDPEKKRRLLAASRAVTHYVGNEFAKGFAAREINFFDEQNAGHA
jgi:hypothetical protein